MDEPRLYDGLREAWEDSTRADNRFGKLLESVDWDEEFYADGEFYYTLGNLVFTTPVKDPFDDRHGISPWMMFSDGSNVAFYD